MNNHVTLKELKSIIKEIISEFKEPGHTAIGSVEDCEVKGIAGNGDKLSHHMDGVSGANSWRYDGNTETLFWWDKDVDEDNKLSVIFWLDKRGFKVKNQKCLMDYVSDGKFKNEATTQQDIKSRHPQPFMPFVGMNQNQPDFSKMTLDNLKAIKDKCKRTVDFLKLHPELRTKKEDLQAEFNLWKSCNVEMKRRLAYINKPIRESQGISNNQVGPMSNCSGVSHGAVSDYDDVQLVRDPLNDPMLNGKLHEEFKFDDFEWLATSNGFNKPSNVYYGTVLIGVIITEPDGYRILQVIGPDGKGINIRKSPRNKFKNKNQAAESLRVAWQLERTGDYNTEI